jgi:peptidoglycan/LPS O-acetylase OafA/YrhL
MRSLTSALDPRRNSLNALRLILAGAVVVSHSWPIGGYGADPGHGPDGSNLGSWAVAGFFVISGYLITASRVNSRSFGDYLWRRVLRIYPAFLVALLLVAFVFAPLSALVDPSATPTFLAGAKFVVKNLALYVNSWGVAGTLSSVPFPGVWIVTFWTLFWEFVCYLIIGVLWTIRRGKASVVTVVAVLFAATTLMTLMHEMLFPNAPWLLVRYVHVSAFFAAGSLVYFARDRLPDSAWLAAASAAALVAEVLTGTFQLLAGLPAAYLMVYLGAHLPLHRVGGKNDISYGLYLYSGPVQQALVLVLGALALKVGPVILAAMSLVAATPLAWGSWLLVEKPALRLKRLTAAAREPRDAATSPATGHPHGAASGPAPALRLSPPAWSGANPT